VIFDVELWVRPARGERTETFPCVLVEHLAALPPLLIRSRQLEILAVKFQMGNPLFSLL
jgi:hypothetical protein